MQPDEIHAARCPKMGHERDDEAGISKSIAHSRGADGNHAKLNYLQEHMPQV